MPPHKHPVNRAMHDDRKRSERAVDSFVGYFGSLRFIGTMTVFIVAWVGLNATAWAFRWDPYPWILLNLIFSTQASYAAPLILLSQNRASERDRLKAEHDYSVNETALAEIRADKELTGEVRSMTAEVHKLVVSLTAMTAPASAPAPAPARRTATKERT